MAIADDTHIFIGGGNSETSEATDQAYVLDAEYSMWIPAKMPTAKRSLTCSGITSADGLETEVIVAGGHDGTLFLNTTEIYSLAEGDWRTGKTT